MHCNAVIPNGARHTTHYTPASDTLTGEPGQATNAGCSEDIRTFPSFYPSHVPIQYHSPVCNVCWRMCQGVSMSQAAQLSPPTPRWRAQCNMQVIWRWRVYVERDGWKVQAACVIVYVECAKAGGAPCVGGPSVLHLVTSWSPVAQVTRHHVPSFLTHLLLLLIHTAPMLPYCLMLFLCKF